MNIELLKPHTHGGIKHQAGDTLAIPGEALPHDADWMVSHEVAKWMTDLSDSELSLSPPKGKKLPQSETAADEGKQHESKPSEGETP